MLTEDALSTLRRTLLTHPIYAAVDDLDSLRLLMREHVFAVWDFMSLLKRMQQLLTCGNVPWLPVVDAEAARLILEIVLGEEADEDGRGGYASHFDLYRQAMQELGADVQPIDTFLHQLREGIDWATALNQTPMLTTTRQFVRHTLHIATHGQPHEVAAAFFYGREDVIPDMFSRLIETIRGNGVGVERLRHYLRRHIELDGDRHGPLAEQLLHRLCDSDAEKHTQATSTAASALQARIHLWNGILAEMERTATRNP